MTDMSIEVGMKGRAETVVSQANTAQAACSGALPEMCIRDS